MEDTISVTARDRHLSVLVGFAAKGGFQGAEDWRKVDPNGQRMDYTCENMQADTLNRSQIATAVAVPSEDDVDSSEDQFELGTRKLGDALLWQFLV